VDFCVACQFIIEPKTYQLVSIINQYKKNRLDRETASRVLYILRDVLKTIVIVHPIIFLAPASELHITFDGASALSDTIVGY
jgi:hypothetical protein